MKTTLQINNISMPQNTVVPKNSHNAMSCPSFKGTKDFSKEEADALAAQHLAAQNLQDKVPPIKEKDVNIAVTCCGLKNVDSNTRELNDYRCVMSSIYGYNWSSYFDTPCIVRNQNSDEKYNGETTALVLPLAFDTVGYRGNDNAVIMLNGQVSHKVIAEMVNYLLEKGVLKREEKKFSRIVVASKYPYEFLSKPQVKKIIANFFANKVAMQATESNNATPVNKPTPQTSKKEFEAKNVNVVLLGGTPAAGNTRAVYDYKKWFLENDKKFTVLHDKYVQNGEQKDMTVLLIPSKKDNNDCITVTVDTKLTYETSKNLVNHLAKNKIYNISEESFKTAIADYLNSVK